MALLANRSMHDLSADFSSDLHDMRRTARLVQLGNAVARDPTRPFPQVLNEAELEAMYRLMNSDAVDETDIAAAHHDETARRSRALQTVLVLHDTTQMSFPIQGDIPMRTHLERVGPRTQGFRVHASLAVSAEPTHEPLGVVCWQPFVGSKRIQQEDEAFWNERGGVFANEGFRWQQGVALANARLEGVEVVHVADREADRYDLLEWMIREGVRFVFRQCHDRNLADDSVFRDRLDEAKEITCLTNVRLSRRLGFKHNGRQRANLPREQRDVDLRVTAARLEIKRGLDPPRSSDRAAWREVAASAFVNFVRVQEVDPAEDDNAIDWVLMTTEPIETAEDVLRIVDFYRARWQIEEFFKAIKTGCAFEKRQSESAGALLNVLALTLPIAWQLLWIRHQASHAPEKPAVDLFKPDALALLRHLTPRHAWGDDPPTVTDVYWAIARIGGHTRRNTHPGWLVLGRGFEDFWKYLEGARAMAALVGQKM